MTAPSTTAPRRGGGNAITDGLLVGWRNLKRIPRIPELAIFAILQSIMFVLLFVFVFGGAINIPGGGDYTPFLMPGIFAQTIVFAAGDDGDRDDRRRQQGDHRSIPLAADVALGGPDGADLLRRHLQRGHPRRPDGHRLRGRLAGREHSGPGRRLRPAAVLRLRDGVARRLARPERADGRGRPAGDLHRPLPDHVHLERVRPGARRCRRGSSRSPSGTRRAP